MMNLYEVAGDVVPVNSCTWGCMRESCPVLFPGYEHWEGSVEHALDIFILQVNATPWLFQFNP